MQRETRQLNPSLRRRGLTLLELLVTVGLVAIVIVSVAQVFSITSTAASATEANASLIKKSRNINKTLEDAVANMAPDCVLAISCAPPIRNTREVVSGPYIPLQHDAIAFAARGNPNQYVSFTDPTRPTAANPELGPAKSSEALIYFGMGDPLTQNPNGILQPIRLDSGNLFAPEWPFVHRAIVLLPEVAPGTDANWANSRLRDMTGQFAIGGLFNNTMALLPQYADGTIDAIVSSNTLRANTQTIAQIIMDKDWDTDLGTNNPSITGLWSHSQAPRTLFLNANFANRKDFYRRGGATFTFGLADFRVEWTDGRPIDPLGPDGLVDTRDENLNTRWFGIRPDPEQIVTAGDLNETVANSGPGVPFYAYRRHDTDPNQTLSDPLEEQALNDLYRDRIEWPRDTDAGTQTAMYRAIWRADTWQYRPKALRFTYRLYDENQRIKNNVEVDFDRDGYADPDFSLAKRQMVRMGREFSVVVPVP